MRAFAALILNAGLNKLGQVFDNVNWVAAGAMLICALIVIAVVANVLDKKGK